MGTEKIGARRLAVGLVLALSAAGLAGCKDDGSAATPSVTSQSASPSVVPTTAESSAAGPRSVPSESAGESATPPAATSTELTSKDVDKLEEQIIKDSGLDPTGGAAAYKGTQTITYRTYTFEAPKDWTDIRDFNDGKAVSAEYDQWVDGSGPGVVVYEESGDPATAMTKYLTGAADFFGTCEAGPLRPYAVGSNTGVAQIFSDCGEHKGNASVVTIAPNGSPVSIIFDASVIDARDISAVAEVMRTFAQS